MNVTSRRENIFISPDTEEIFESYQKWIRILNHMKYGTKVFESLQTWQKDLYILPINEKTINFIKHRKHIWISSRGNTIWGSQKLQRITLNLRENIFLLIRKLFFAWNMHYTSKIWGKTSKFLKFAQKWLICNLNTRELWYMFKKKWDIIFH